MATQPYNVSIIGYGMSAKVFHIPLIQLVSDFRLYAIVQRTPKPSDDAEKDHPEVRCYRSTEEMFKDPKIDIVVVTTPPETHFELAKLALENGKHVVVEKPFTPTAQEADELITIAKNNDRLLTVYHNRRWDSDFLTLLNLINDNRLGRIVEFETHFDRHRPQLGHGKGWKTKSLPGGGVVYDLGTHLIDQVMLTFGLPKSITGFVGSQRVDNPGGYEDACTVLLHYDALLATVKAGVVSPEKNQLRYWVRGVNGSYKKFHMDPQEDHLKAGLLPSSPNFGQESPERSGTLTTVQRNGDFESESWPNVTPPLTYKKFYEQFAQALSGLAEVPVKPEEAREVIRLVELARRSAREGRTLKA